MGIARMDQGLAGKWVAEAPDGSVIESASTLDELEQLLVERHGYTDEKMPVIRHVAEDGSASFLL